MIERRVDAFVNGEHAGAQADHFGRAIISRKSRGHSVRMRYARAVHVAVAVLGAACADIASSTLAVYASAGCFNDVTDSAAELCVELTGIFAAIHTQSRR